MSYPKPSAQILEPQFAVGAWCLWCKEICPTDEHPKEGFEKTIRLWMTKHRKRCRQLER